MLKSTTAVTYELDDIASGTDELARTTKEKLKFARNSFGLMFCDSDVDHAKFASELARKLGVPIVGYSATAMFSDGEGLCDTAVVLTTVTSDDVNFSIATSEPLTSDNIAAQIALTYDRAKASLEGEPKLVLAFPPYLLGIMLDIYPRELERASGGLPIFGGLPAHDDVHGRTAVYCGDSAASDRMTLLLMSGNVKPVMTVKNPIGAGALANLKRTVTQSKHNVIYKVGDESFVAFLKRFGLDVEKLANPDEKTISFTTYPLLIENTGGENPDGIPVVRTLHGVDLKEGTGTAIGEVPEGSIISVGILQPKDIEKSSSDSIRDLTEKMSAGEAEGYKYSTVFAISCVARYYVMANRNTLEADALKSKLPPGLSMAGYYSFGEICPTSIRPDKAMNAAHNESLVLLAL
ncbi:MAG: FIST C-terminal domain-containing protein [Synergistaceae bacterium]|jgi:hypothetical protein|nr:FIST C-terminal domain-containing protein [Synergistaceae bacterium]